MSLEAGSGVTAITLFCDDLPAAREFYGRAFGADPIFEDEDSSAYRIGPTVINLLRAEAAGDLVAPAAVGGPGAGARFQLTLEVGDVDAACADLASRGVALLNGPQDRPWGIRTAAFADPSGHVWELAGPLV